MMSMSETPNVKTPWHGTTVLSVRRAGTVVIAGDGQVTQGDTVIKANARKVRRLAGGAVLAGFAGATADAFTLFDRLDAKLERHPGQLMRACVELARDWRTDRYLRRLEAVMAVADREVSLLVSGVGDVVEPADGLIGIGSGGGFALAAARALSEVEGLDAEDIARRALAVAAELCIYTNHQISVEVIHQWPRLHHARSSRSSIDSLWASGRQSGRWPSRFGIAGAASSWNRRCGRKSSPRTS